MTDDGPLFCLALFAYLCALDIYVCPLSISIPSLFLVVSSFIRYFVHPLFLSFSSLSLSSRLPFPSFLTLSLSLLHISPLIPLSPTIDHHSLSSLFLSPSLYTHSSPFPSGSSPPSPPLHSCCCHPLRYLISSSPTLQPHPTRSSLTHSRIHPQAYTHTFKLILTLPTRTPQLTSLQLICACTFARRPYVHPPLSIAPYLSPSPSPPTFIFQHHPPCFFFSECSSSWCFFLLYACSMLTSFSFAAQRGCRSPAPPN
ncbi:hypothetical protein BKA57DRAFT_70892 [Linnemannia elongata]|nr:hypothetical protein BKA57DRAFT_70892 [Linnemannia elongata]